MTEIFYLTRHLRTNQPYGDPMAHVDPESARSLLDGAIAAFSVLGGGMAYLSGYYANQALAQNQSPEQLSQRVNEGLGLGFRFGSPLSIVALIIMAWS